MLLAPLQISKRFPYLNSDDFEVRNNIFTNNTHGHIKFTGASGKMLCPRNNIFDQTRQNWY